MPQLPPPGRPPALRALPFRAAALLPLLALAGCFQLRALVAVEADGSGTLEETVLISGFLRQMMEEDTTGRGDLYDADSLRAHAARLGPGVRFVRVDTIRTEADFGYRAVYAFADVTALRFHFNPHPLPQRGGGGSPDDGGALLAGSSGELPVTFGWAAEGGARVLRVRMPEPAASAQPAALDPARVAAATDSLRRQMASAGPAVAGVLDQIRLRLEVRGPGPLTETDARFVTDSSVVLFDFPLGAFVGLTQEKPELVARAQLLQAAGTPDPRPVVRALAARPGVQYELRPEVTARFGR